MDPRKPSPSTDGAEPGAPEAPARGTSPLPLALGMALLLVVAILFRVCTS